MTGGNEMPTDTSDLAIVGMMKPNATARRDNPKNDFFILPPPRRRLSTADNTERRFKPRIPVMK
jgi:hypothetical protein